MIRIICLLLFACCHAGEKYPVDVCYMVADLKYNARQGVKICEIQQASLSLFNGNEFRNLEEESIHQELLRTLSLYNQKGWVVAGSLADKNLVSTLASSSFWQSPNDLIALVSHPDFKYQSRQPVMDVYDLRSYQGFLYVNWSQLSVISDFEKRYPGMVVMDKSSFSFWIDKFKMTELFAGDKTLSAIKPKWGNYKKIYSPELADNIAKELQCDLFVIKPRGNFLGNGVIITSREDLDDILSYIINKDGKWAESNDSAYTAWKTDSFDSFIVEEFIASDPITIPHLENKTYQPTMRVAFLLVYNKLQHHVHFLGGYWKTPMASSDEEGDFMQKNKDVCKPPYYCTVDPKIMLSVTNQLQVALPLLHSKMLSSSKEEFSTPTKNEKIKLVLQETGTSH